MTKNTYSVRSHAASTVKQVGGEDTPGLAAQELAPRRSGSPWGRAEAMATQQRSDGRHTHAGMVRAGTRHTHACIREKQKSLRIGFQEGERFTRKTPRITLGRASTP